MESHQLALHHLHAHEAQRNSRPKICNGVIELATAIFEPALKEKQKKERRMLAASKNVKLNKIELNIIKARIKVIINRNNNHKEEK